jgi:hypothetical protein
MDSAIIAVIVTITVVVIATLIAVWLRKYLKGKPSPKTIDSSKFNGCKFCHHRNLDNCTYKAEIVDSCDYHCPGFLFDISTENNTYNRWDPYDR